MPDGRWRIRVEGPRHPDGRRQQVSATFPSKRDAVQWRAATLVGLGEQVATTSPSSATFSDVADWWHQQKAVTVRAVTVRGYASALAPARAAFGDVPVVELTADHVRALVAAVSRDDIHGFAVRASERATHVLS